MFQEGPKPLYNGQVYYREVGNFLRLRCQYEKSKPAYGESLNINEQDERTLEGRSWAGINTLDYKGAMEDIDKALEILPGDLRFLAQKALITYLDCNFEDAYVENLRGYRKRKQPPYFIQGCKACNETIENCLGERVGHPLRDYYDIIRTIAMKKAYDLRKGFQVTSKYKRKKKRKLENTIIQDKIFKNVPRVISQTSLKSCKGSIIDSLNERNEESILYKPAQKSEYQPLQKCTTNIDNLLAEKYLEHMYLDKLFLKALKGDIRLQCPNYEGTKKIQCLAKNGYNDTVRRQKILHTRKPFYSIKYAEGVLRHAVQKRQEGDLSRVQQICQRNVEKYLEDLDDAREALQTEECIRISNILKTYIDKTPLKILPKKEFYLRTMYELIGQAHLDKYRINPKASEQDQLKRIQFLFLKPISREPSQDSVMKHCKGRFLDQKQEMRQVEKRIRKATTPLETTWLYYELSRYNNDLKKYDLGRVYGRKCINLAKAIDNYVWATNGSLQICIAHIQQGKRNEAKNELLRTQQLAMNLEDNEKILEFIDKVLNSIEQLDVKETIGTKVVQMREKAIMKNILQPHVKTEMSHLLAKMAAIPQNRRLAIMPGIASDEAFKFMDVKKHVKSRHTIMPRADDDFLESIKTEPIIIL